MCLGVWIAIHANWIFYTGPLVSGDWVPFSNAQLREWSSVHPQWIAYESLGRVITQTNFVGLFSTYSILASLGMGFELISRLLFFGPILLAPVFSFALLYRITSQKISSLAGAVLYSFNSYFLVIQGGHLHLSVVYSLFPLQILSAFLLSQHTHFRYVLYFTLVTGVTLLYDVRIGMLTFVFAALVGLITAQQRKRYSLHVSIAGLLSILLHMFWIPMRVFTQASQTTTEALNARPLNWVNIQDAITLHHPFWGPNGVEDFVFFRPSFLFYLPLIALLVAIITSSSRPALTRRNTLMLGLALSSILLSIQQNSDFENLYNTVYDSVPLMSAFREGSKFFTITAAVYALLLATNLSYIEKRGREHFALYGLAVMAIIPTIFIAAAYVPASNKVKTYAQSSFTEELRAVNEYLDSGNDYQRTLWISRVPKFVDVSYSNVHLGGLQVGSSLFGDRPANNPDVQHYLPNIRAIANLLGIDYVAVAGDTVESQYQHYNFRSADSYTEQLLRENRFDDRLDIGDTTLLKNEQHKDYIYVSDSINFIDGSLIDFSGKESSAHTAHIFADTSAIPHQDLIGIIDSYELHAFSDANLVVEDGQLTTQYEPIAEGAFEITTVDEQGDVLSIPANQNDILDLDGSGFNGQSLVVNGDFEDEASNPRIGDCNNFDGSSRAENGITGQRDPTSYPGSSNSYRITADQHIACFSFQVENFRKDRNYILMLDYRTQGIDELEVGLFPYETEPFRRVEQLPNSAQWTRESIVIENKDFEDEMTLIFYLPTEDGSSAAWIDNVALYELPDLSDRYLTTSQTTPLGGAQASYTSLSPVKKQVNISSLSDTEVLVFSESFHPQWEVRAGTQPVEGAQHIVANGFANGWIIDPKVVCQQDGVCTQNSDGSWDLELTVEFTPQQWFYRGLAVSLVTLSGVVGYLLYSTIPFRRQKK